MVFLAHRDAPMMLAAVWSVYDNSAETPRLLEHRL